jgi:hypothetical protein
MKPVNNYVYWNKKMGLVKKSIETGSRKEGKELDSSNCPV